VDGETVKASDLWYYVLALVVRIKTARALFRRLLRKLFGIRPNGREHSSPRAIPKILWMFWDSGEETAPELVKLCIASWRKRNPNWTVHVLDRDSVAAYVEMPEMGNLSIQSYADLLRTRLLRVHGGVWADATCFCLRPLDHWLPVVAQRGFFAYFWTRPDRWFIRPGYFRMIANWFLASEPNGTIISTWESYSVRYCSMVEKENVYFWHATLFETLLYMKRSFRKAFDEIPKLGGYSPHILHDYVIDGRNLQEAFRLIEVAELPLQKLTWRMDPDHISKIIEVLKSKSP
jgi:hypothetical protein